MFHNRTTAAMHSKIKAFYLYKYNNFIIFQVYNNTE